MHNNAKKYQHKVTPQVYKELKTIAKNLPGVPALDGHNKPVYKMETRIKRGNQFPEGAKDSSGKPYDPNGWYSLPSEPVIRQQNHEVALINAYQLFAWKGVDAYIKTVNDYVKVLDQASQLAEKIKKEIGGTTVTTPYMKEVMDIVDNIDTKAAEVIVEKGCSMGPTESGLRIVKD